MSFKKILLAGVAWLALAGFAGEYPFIVFRLTGSPNRKPEFFRQACAVHAKYRGAFDDFWYGGGKPLCKLEACRADMRTFAVNRPAIEAAGMSLSFQQGLTTIHDYFYVGKAGTPAAAGVYDVSEAYPFPDDAWMVRPDGRVAKGRCLCPRAPSVLEYEYQFVKEVLRELRPVTFWLDDDLRLGIGKVGCFCPRCLAAFNAEYGFSFTRDTLTARLFGKEPIDDVREKWSAFNEMSLACYGAAARRAANEVMPDCRLALQTVSADCLLNGRDYGPVLRALSDNGRVPSGLRPGHGCYTEDDPFAFLEKAFWCTREAERSRRLGAVCGTICYEQETYTRRVFHKSPGAIVTECALALASGCDTLSLYWADREQPERIEDYERFVKTVAAARPYFERLAASTRRTSLGGVARYLGANVYRQEGFSLSDASDLALMRAGIPVTVAEASAAHKVWRVTPKSKAAMDAADWAKLKETGCLEIAAEARPFVATRQAWLDELDRLTKGRFPVRIELPHAMRVLPRVDARGKTDSVTLLNLSMGDTGAFDVRIRNPRGRSVIYETPKGTVPGVKTAYDTAHDELYVTLPDLAGWHIGTLFLE